jgi:hypothetical protein
MGLKKQHSSIDLVLAINLLWLGAKTFSIATLSLMTFSIKYTQHNKSVILVSAVMLCDVIFLLLC